MENKNFFLIAVSLLAIQLTGCATKPKIAINNDGQDLRAAGIRLAETAESVNKSLQELAKINRSLYPQARLPSPIIPDMIGMGQLGSIDWSGPVEPVVKKIAQATKYKLTVLGTLPAIPILVSITAKDVPLADILRDIAFQCGSKANIVTYPASRVIELRYVKA